MTEEDDQLIRDCFIHQVKLRQDLASKEALLEDLAALLEEIQVYREQTRMDVHRIKRDIRQLTPRTLSKKMECSEHAVRKIYDEEVDSLREYAAPKFGRVY